MSSHPNAMLLLVMTPDDLARKTYRAILAELDDSRTPEESDGYVKIAGADYHSQVMEEEYDENHQVQAKEGDIVFWDLVTYGYGDRVPWVKLEVQKNALEEWAKGICERHRCKYEIFVSANYW